MHLHLTKRFLKSNSLYLEGKSPRRLEWETVYKCINNALGLIIENSWFFRYWMSINLTSRNPKIFNILHLEGRVQNVELQPVSSKHQIKLLFLITDKGVSLKINIHMNVLFLFVFTHNSINRLLLIKCIKIINYIFKLVFNFLF